MNIGIFAGTFDPIHAGHIAFAQTAISEAGLDKVIIVAEKEPYRKKPFASWDHRQAMIERATELVNQVDHDYAFAAQLAHQHTMKNMLAVAEQHYGEGNQYWFLVGSDIFEHMHTWQDIAKDHDYAGFVVALRDNHTREWLQEQQKKVHDQGIRGTVIVVTNHQPHVSSSAIRRAIREGSHPESAHGSVVDYIRNHDLYSQ